MFAISKLSEIFFLPSTIIISQSESAKVPLLVRYGSINFQKDLLASTPLSDNLFK